MSWIRPRLWVPPDARCAIVHEGDGLVCVAPDGERRWGVGAPGLLDAVVVGDELWSCEAGGVFRRRALADGLVTGELQDARANGPGHLVASAYAPIAIWCGAQLLRLVGDDGFAAFELAGTADFAMPIAAGSLLYLR